MFASYSCAFAVVVPTSTFPVMYVAPPMYALPAIPAPPAQINGPVPVLVLAVAFANVSATSVPIAAVSS